MPRYDLKNAQNTSHSAHKSCCGFGFNLFLEIDEIREGVMDLWSSMKLVVCPVIFVVLMVVVIIAPSEFVIAHFSAQVEIYECRINLKTFNVAGILMQKNRNWQNSAMQT